MPRKKAIDLLENPVFLGQRKQPDPPVTTGMRHITTTTGPLLEEMGRIRGPQMIEAHEMAIIYIDGYGSKYIRRQIETMDRLSIGIDGLGRREIIDIVEAGGRLPDAYYTGENKQPSWRPVNDDGAAE